MPAGKGAADAVPAGSVLAALQQATHVTLQTLAARLDQLSLSPSEQNVLAALAADRVLAVGELAVATSTRPSTLTSVLDRLERRALLERDVDYSDRRSVLIRLTPDGRQMAAAVRAAMAAIERSALAAISREQLAGFFVVTSALTEVRA